MTSLFFWLSVGAINSRTSTLRTLAISNNVFNDACDEFVHHFDIVAGSLSNCSANHLLFFSFQPEQLSILFISAMIKSYIIPYKITHLFYKMQDNHIKFNEFILLFAFLRFMPIKLLCM